MNNHNPTTMFECQQNIGDYFVIWNHGRRLEPKDTITLHLRSLTNLEEFLAEHKNEKVVVITHHGPSYLATPERFKRYRDTNGAFYSDLSELILDNPHILYWIHGHTHDPFEFDIGETKVLGNPRGYHKSESSAMNFAPRTIEIT
jgi:DNA repair exonuclease SbcCD nuclease subunit